MKKTVFLFFLAGIWVGCNYNYKETVTYKINEPVFIDASEFRNSVKVTKEQHKISDYGKICFYHGFLYISESEVGIHIIDNTNPSQPRIVGFIELVGNADLAIRNNRLYADSYIDLVWFDITDPADPKLSGRLENAFPEALPIIDNQYGYDYNMCYSTNGSAKGVVVGWTLHERTEKVDNTYRHTIYDGLYYTNGSSNKTGSQTTGVNGSISRFALYNDYLYAVINYQMCIFDLTSNPTPTKVNNDSPFYVGDVETIFSYKNNMFLGTPAGMVIYSVENPTKPVYCSSVWHVYGCDPVVVDNDLAYVTVHSGNMCGQNTNELSVYNVSNVKSPQFLVSYAMTNPKGLGIDNNTLFLCDDGLKVFKISSPQTLMANQLAHQKGMDGFDVIPFDKVLMMIADNGLYQYDYSDINNIKQISVIPIGKN